MKNLNQLQHEAIKKHGKDKVIGMQGVYRRLQKKPPIADGPDIMRLPDDANISNRNRQWYFSDRVAQKIINDYFLKV